MSLDMDEREDKTANYLIPENVTARFEFFPGFGFFELVVVSIASAFGIVIFMALSIFPISVLARAFAIIIPGAGAFIVVKKDQSSNTCLLDILKNAKAFNNKQKRYMYKSNSGRG